MDFLWWLALGALIGWLAEWVIDWIYWRRRLDARNGESESGRNGQVDLGALRSERDKLRGELQACGERVKGLDGELAPLRARVGELEPLAVRVGELHAENARLRDELEAANATQAPEGFALGGTADAATSLLADETSSDFLALRDANMQLHDELGATRRALARLTNGRGDLLIDINGIGPVYQQKLYDAGVLSFDQLASMDPAQLHSLVAADNSPDVDTTLWIDEARSLATRTQRDPLIDINGIGPVYEQRLLAAGVATFDQVAAMSAAEIRAIIKPESWQNIDPEAWSAEARTLAQQVRDGTYRKGRY